MYLRHQNILASSIKSYAAWDVQDQEHGFVKIKRPCDYPFQEQPQGLSKLAYMFALPARISSLNCGLVKFSESCISFSYSAR